MVGRRSPYSLYDLSLATYGAGDAFDQSEARGYVRLAGLPISSNSTGMVHSEQMTTLDGVERTFRSDMARYGRFATSRLTSQKANW